MTDRPTCGQCYHFVPAKGDGGESTCHAHAPRDSGGWAPVEHDDVACGSDYVSADSVPRGSWGVSKATPVEAAVERLAGLLRTFHEGTDATLRQAKGE